MSLVARHVESERQEKGAKDFPSGFIVEIDLPILRLTFAQPLIIAGRNCWRIPVV